MESYWKTAIIKSKQAVESGALIPLRTKRVDIKSNTNAPFELRKLISEKPLHLNKEGPKTNPFLPWDKRLEVANIGNNHVLILNKFPVQFGHMLLITRSWSPQNGWLGERDWEALVEVENDTKGLWFFNSSPESGASQPHRHLQLLRRKSNELLCPRSYIFDDIISRYKTTELPTDNGHYAYPRKAEQTFLKIKELQNNYLELARVTGLGDPRRNDYPLFPYNLLITPRWITLIKRSRDSYQGFSINALGFAGYLLITTESNIEWLERYGPNELLKRVM